MYFDFIFYQPKFSFFPYRHGATCHDKVGTFMCECPPSKTGLLCHLEDSCASNPCHAQANCEVNPTNGKNLPVFAVLSRGVFGIFSFVQFKNYPLQIRSKAFIIKTDIQFRKYHIHIG